MQSGKVRMTKVSPPAGLINTKQPQPNKLQLMVGLCLALATTSPAVEFRAATYNIGAHFTSEGYPNFSLGAPTTEDFKKVRDVLQRINADVVALQEVHSADLSGNPNHLSTLATELGYPFIYIAPVAASPPPESRPGPLDTSLRVAFLSRHPFVSTQVIRSPIGAKEITRLMPAVKVDIPGSSNDPLLISGHLKAGSTSADRFRRCVEMQRLTQFLSEQELTEDDNFIILGDFNLSSSNLTFNALPPDLIGSFVLGTDLSLPLSYSNNPLSYFSNPSVIRLDPRQLNGSKATFQSGSVIDLFLVSPAIAGRPLTTEIYNSVHDTSNSLGLPKSGAPLAAGTSATASDHYAVFGDFELDEEFPNLSLALSSNSVREDSAVGTANLSITLPAPRSSPVVINLHSDDPNTANPSTSTLSIPPGQTSASVTVITRRNFIQDPPRSVSFTASATNYDPDSAMLVVTDVDGPYSFTAAGQSLTENFDGFSGTHPPAPWSDQAGNWLGSDLGESSIPGFRAYGPITDRAPGFLPERGDQSISSRFTNQSSRKLTALEISYHAEQWRVIHEGTADRITVDLIIEGNTMPLPSLSFEARTQTSLGLSHGEFSETKSLTLGGLNIPPNASFEIRFNFTQGPGGGPPSNDVFVNEFHYDNVGADAGEFIEVLVAPGFSGNLADIDIRLYNGADGNVYGTHNLADPKFSLGSTINGFRIFSAQIPSIQNGSPDGIGVMNRVTGQLLDLLSYEGTFSGVGGLPTDASISSKPIGVSQDGTDPIGQNALGLIGSGASKNDFTWSKILGPSSMGQINHGQSLIDSSKRSQGIAIDNLSVTFLTDRDGDGIPDVSDDDNDNDGIRDSDELTFGSDPDDASSVYRISYTHPSAADGMGQLKFPTTPGRSYTVEFSTNLSSWTALRSYAGSGSERVIDLPVQLTNPRRFYRVRVTLSQ